MNRKDYIHCDRFKFNIQIGCCANRIQIGHCSCEEAIEAIEEIGIVLSPKKKPKKKVKIKKKKLKAKRRLL